MGSCSWRSEGLFSQSFSVAPPIQALRGISCLGSFSVVPPIRHIEGPPWLGSYSVDWRIRHLKGHPGWGPTVVQCVWYLIAQALLLFSCQCWRVERERLWWWLHPLPMTQLYRLASMAARLSSTGISHHELLPPYPLDPSLQSTAALAPGLLHDL